MAFFNQAVTMLMAVFFLLGTLDRLIGNKFGLGKEYEGGFAIMGKVALVIIGLYCLAPVLGDVLGPVIIPFYHFIGADPAMFGPTFLTIDAGGYALATTMCDDPQMGRFAGVVVSTLTGAAISYTIPIAIVILNKEDFKIFSIGMMVGIAAGPFGAFVAGLAFGLSAGYLAINLLSVIVVAILIILGLSFVPKIAIVAFRVIAKIVAAVIAIGLGAAGFEALTKIVLIPGMNPLSEGAGLVGKIIVVVSGAMCLLYTVQKLAAKPIAAVSRRIGINDSSMLSIFVSMAATVAVFPEFPKMDTRGKLLVSAIAPTLANLCGGHLGFTATVDPDMIIFMYIGKVVSGIIAIILALYFAKRLYPEECGEKTA